MGSMIPEAGLILSSDSSERTDRIGFWLGKHLIGGHFIGLEGELGAGKTVLARGICEGAGVDPKEISSPTFAIVQTYSGRIPVHHADFYRLGSEEELQGTGFFDLLAPDEAMVVEWLNRVRSAAPPERLEIQIAIGGEGARSIRATAFGEGHCALLEAWRREARF